MVQVPGLEEKEESLTLLEKFAEELGDLEERILNSRINNIEERPFLERDEVIQSIVTEMKLTQRLKINKPRVVCLWSPRGMGKSSVIRRLAKMDEFAESRRCGRLLIFDAAWIPSGQMSVEASTLVSAWSCGTFCSCLTATALSWRGRWSTSNAWISRMWSRSSNVVQDQLVRSTALKLGLGQLARLRMMFSSSGVW